MSTTSSFFALDPGVEKVFQLICKKTVPMAWALLPLAFMISAFAGATSSTNPKQAKDTLISLLKRLIVVILSIQYCLPALEFFEKNVILSIRQAYILSPEDEAQARAVSTLIRKATSGPITTKDALREVWGTLGCPLFKEGYKMISFFFNIRSTIQYVRDIFLMFCLIVFPLSAVGSLLPFKLGLQLQTWLRYYFAVSCWAIVLPILDALFCVGKITNDPWMLMAMMFTYASTPLLTMFICGTSIGESTLSQTISNFAALTGTVGNFALSAGTGQAVGGVAGVAGTIAGQGLSSTLSGGLKSIPAQQPTNADQANRGMI